MDVDTKDREDCHTNGVAPTAAGGSRPTAISRLIDRFSELTGWYRLRLLVRGSVIAFGAIVKTPSRLHAGRRVTVQRGTIIHCGGREWSGFGGYVNLHDGVKIGPYAILYGAGGIDLEANVHLGPGVKIMSQAGKHDEFRLTSQPTYLNEPVRIGAGSWIGAGAVVLGGTTIGRCVSVAPNALVSGVIPDGAVVVGNPARIMFRNPVERQ